MPKKGNTEIDIDKICRTCLSEGQMQPLYKKCSCIDEEKCISEMLNTCTLLQFSRNDGLPSQICLDCVNEINSAYRFVRKCEKSDEFLRARLKETPPKRPKITKTRSKIKTRSQRLEKIDIKSENNENKPKTDNIKPNTDNNSYSTDTNQPFSSETTQNNDTNLSTGLVSKEPTNLDLFNQKTTLSSDSNLVINEPNLGLGPNHVSKDSNPDPVKFESKPEPEFDDFDPDSYDSDVKSEVKDELEIPEDFDDDFGLRKFKRRRNLRVKKGRKVKSVPPYECKKCFLSFPTFKELAEHRRVAQHPKNVYNNRICPVCNKSIGYSRLNQHMRTHTQEKPYCCELCGTRFSISSNLRRHMMSRHSSEKPYKCDVCEKGFTRLGLLKDHMRIHTGERPFVCNFCGKSFAQSSSFRTHLFNHAKKGENAGQMNEEDHHCSICERSFVSKALLKAHQVIHGEKKFLCSDCGKGFVSMILLRSHSKVHSGVRPHGCNICGKTFSHIGSLKSHLLIHSGEKPYLCKICNRAFTQRTHVKYHMRTHSGERPYGCSVCGKRFALNGNLTVHMRTHTGETPYLCPDCGRGFHDSSSMKKHLRGHQITNK